MDAETEAEAMARLDQSRANVRLMGRLAGLAGAGSAGEFAATFHEAARSWRARWPWCGHMPSYAVRPLSTETAGAVRSDLESRLRDTVPGARLDGFDLTQLLTVYPLLLTGSEAVPLARDILAATGRWWVCGASVDLAASLLLLRERGETIPVAVVATMRRETSVVRYWPEFTALVKELDGPVLNPGEEWADELLDFLGTASDDWRDLVGHLGTATSAKPSARWLKRTNQLVAGLGEDSVRERVVAWVGLVGQPRTIPVDDTEYFTHFNDQFDPYNVTFLRGLVWMLGVLPPERDAIRLLAGLVDITQRKIPGVGVRSQLITNAAIYALEPRKVVRNFSSVCSLELVCCFAINFARIRRPDNK